MPSVIKRRGKVHGLSGAVVAAEPRPPLISNTGSLFVPTFSQTAPPTSFGPVGGAQSVRDGAGARTVATPALPYVAFANQNELTTGIAGNPAGTKFVWTGGAGTFAWPANVDTTTKAPKIYFPGAPGTVILSGRNSNIIALTLGDGAEVHGGHFINFGAASQSPPVVHGLQITGADVIVQDVMVSGSRVCGVSFAAGSTDGLLSHCTLFNNGEDGYQGGNTDNLTIEFCNIYGNNTLSYDVGNQGGAGKILHSDVGEFKNNWVHDNLGFGIWFDTDWLNWNIHDNVSENNSRTGFFFEAAAVDGTTKASGNTVHHNLSQNNGRNTNIGGNTPSAENCVQYRIADSACTSASPGLFHHNIADYVSTGSVPSQTTTFGKLLLVWDHTGSAHRHIENWTLSQNQFWLRGSLDTRVGGQQSSTGVSDIYHLWDLGVSFSNNEYHVASNSIDYWKWGVTTTDESGSAQSFSEWQAFHTTGETRVLI